MIYTRNAPAASVMCVGGGDMRRRRGWCALASVICAGGGDVPAAGKEYNKNNKELCSDRLPCLFMSITGCLMLSPEDVSLRQEKIICFRLLL